MDKLSHCGQVSGTTTDSVIIQNSIDKTIEKIRALVSNENAHLSGTIKQVMQLLEIMTELRVKKPTSIWVKHKDDVIRCMNINWSIDEITEIEIEIGVTNVGIYFTEKLYKNLIPEMYPGVMCFRFSEKDGGRDTLKVRLQTYFSTQEFIKE